MTNDTAAAALLSLVIEEPFTHTVPQTFGAVHYPIAVIRFIDGDVSEIAGLLVAGEVHRMCKRCGEGFGHYSFNGEDDICYECRGDAHGASSTFEEIARLARNRVASRRRAAAKAARLEAERIAGLEAWKTANADLVEALAPYAPTFDAWGEAIPAKGFLGDIAATLEVRAPSERQTEAVRKVIADKAAKVVVECPEGRLVVEGKIIGVKEVDDTFSYYGGKIYKMTVADDRGFRVFGTMPSSIADPIYAAWEASEREEQGDHYYRGNYGSAVWTESAKGTRVRFTGTLERSAKDADFGFFKRPAKAEILPAD